MFLTYKVRNNLMKFCVSNPETYPSYDGTTKTEKRQPLPVAWMAWLQE
jgi:hypothetical protein